MRITTPSLVLASAVLAAAALTVNTASAETVHVPFSFTVDGKTMPAGDYIVHRNILSQFVSLENRDVKLYRNWVLGPGDAAPDSRDVKVLFDKKDTGYELRSIQYRSLTTARLDKSKPGNPEVHVLRAD